MEPIKFKEQNTNFVAEGCLDLPAYKAEDQIISCWKLTEDDIKTIQSTGVIWFSVMGHQQPPIWLSSKTPFLKEGD